MTGFNQMETNIELTRNVSRVGVFVCVCGFLVFKIMF